MSEFRSDPCATRQWADAVSWAGAFLAGFKSPQTRRSYRRDLDRWFALCAAHGVHPYRVSGEPMSTFTFPNSRRKSHRLRPQRCTVASPH
jgi:hypothetical protein